MSHLRVRQGTLVDLPYLENVEREAAALGEAGYTLMPARHDYDRKFAMISGYTAHRP